MNTMIKRALKEALQYVNLTTSVRYTHTRFKIPVIRRLGIQNLKKEEPWMMEMLDKLLLFNSEGIFIDIGVNLGQTLLKLRSLFPEMDYYGFEPNPVCCFYLEELINLNRLKKVNIFPIAIGETADIVTLYIHDSNDTAGSSASLLKDFKDRAINFRKNIPVFPLDFFSHKFFQDKPVNLLKIDVEGAELEVLKGSMSYIRAAKPIISCELLPPINSKTREETLERKRQIQKLLESESYQYYKILKTSKNTLAEIIQVSDLAGETLKREGWDYLFVPPSKREFFACQFNINMLETVR